MHTAPPPQRQDVRVQAWPGPQGRLTWFVRRAAHVGKEGEWKVVELTTDVP